ncbi:MAG: efflux RND transporter periplasmic adaptor subunit [Phycisphaerae bacterium]|nr:efflux RND transporter periplasmic adaptor subunit [Phycisphaerae bacterium]
MIFNKKLIISTVAIILIISGLGILSNQVYATLGDKEAPKTENTAAQRPILIAQPGSVAQNGNTTFPGTVQASQQAVLFFRVSGPVITVNIKPGDSVKQGQVLMQIDPRDYQRQLSTIQSQIAAANASLAAMKKGARTEDINILEQTLIAAKSTLGLAKTEFDRYRLLIEKDAVSKEYFDRANTAYQVANANYNKLEQELLKAQRGSRAEDIDAAQANLDTLKVSLQIAQDKLNDTKLCAPFDGVITRQMLENYEMAQSGQPVLEIQDISTVEVAVDLPEKNIGSLIQNKESICHAKFFAIGPKTFDAEFYEWSSKADQATRTFRIVFRVQQTSKNEILPGMSAEIAIASNKKNQNGSVLVPMSSLTETNGKTAKLWVVDTETKTAKIREVAIGSRNGDSNIIITAGLDANDWIVTAGGDFIREDQPLNLNKTILSTIIN